MKTNELLQLQALKFKERVMEDRPDFDEVDGMPAWMRDNYDANAETRNICAMIPVALFDEIQRLGGGGRHLGQQRASRRVEDVDVRFAWGEAAIDEILVNGNG